MGTSLSGTIAGHDCTRDGRTCAALEPQLTLERDFVRVRDDGAELCMPNRPRDTKLRDVLKRVTVDDGRARSRQRRQRAAAVRPDARD